MSLTRAQRRVLTALALGGQVWAVADAEMEEGPEEGDPEKFPILAYFSDGEFVGTESVQRRTLDSLARLGLIEGDLYHQDYNGIRLRPLR